MAPASEGYPINNVETANKSRLTFLFFNSEDIILIEIASALIDVLGHQRQFGTWDRSLVYPAGLIKEVRG